MMQWYVLIVRLNETEPWAIKEPFTDHDLALKQLRQWQLLLPDHQWEMHPMNANLFEAFKALTVQYETHR